MSHSDDEIHERELNISHSYLPVCDASKKPYIGQVFKSIDAAFDFYRVYGHSCGFGVRKGSAKKGKYGQVLYRYFVCTREGIIPGTQDEAEDISNNNIKRRRKPSTRKGCKARIKISLQISGEYAVTIISEAHNHEFITVECRHLMKFNRKIDESHQMIMLRCAKANIGPMRAFRIFKELVGSYDEVGCTSKDFKNLSYEMNTHADGVDAQLLLDRFLSRREVEDGFKCEYLTDETDKVKSIFWSDSIGVQNYNVFGDAVSFDATYSTNRYDMIFAPFTGKDNHGGCITFAAGLLTREDVSSYSWLLKQFVDSMGNTPRMFITDQDLALKIAVENVMPNTRHRFCMWHIMMKLAQKLPISLRDNAELTSKIHHVVWSDFDEPADFEKKWHEVLDEYELDDHTWFADMFSKRTYWIPAYFRDLSMSGLFRTTSLSESENSFFRKYLNHNSNLASFYIHFESAMEAQRHTYKQLCMVDQTTVPQLRTHTPLEQHASLIYTSKIFQEVQAEIMEAVNRCCIKKMDTGPQEHIYDIDDRSNGVFHVVHQIHEDTITCSCKHFVKKGLVCRHMFVVMRNIGLKSIPSKYIVHRWLKVASAGLLSSNSTKTGNKSLVVEAFRCIGIADGNDELTDSLLAELKRWADNHTSDIQCSSMTTGKDKMFEMFYGSKLPTEVTVHPPDAVKTKGSGKRLKSTYEREVEKAKKPKRRCKKCGRLVRHNSRNCGKVVEEDSDE